MGVGQGGRGVLVSGGERERFAGGQRAGDRRRGAFALQHRLVFVREFVECHVVGVCADDRVGDHVAYFAVRFRAGFLGDRQFGFLFGGHFRGRALFGGPGRREARKGRRLNGIHPCMPDVVCARAGDRFARGQRGRYRRRAAESFFFWYVFDGHLVLHSFPTRRSSDLVGDHVAYFAVRFRAGFLGDRQFGFLFGGHFRGRALFGGPGRR